MAKKISEPVSLLHRIESGNIRPNPAVARKLEKTLGVKLVAEAEETDFEDTGKAKDDFTLGDVIVVRKKDK